MTEMPDPRTFVNEGAADQPRTTQGQEPAGKAGGPGLLRILLAVRRARLGRATMRGQAVSGAARKAVLLALATYADDTGGSIYPPVSMIVADTELSERAVQLALQTPTACSLWSFPARPIQRLATASTSTA